jgi:thioredoxin 1
MKRIVEIDDANFEREVLKSSQPVLVEFATGWSLPSVMFDGSMDEIANEFVEDLKLATVKLDRNPKLGLWYGIQSVPTVLYFVDGEARIGIFGTASKGGRSGGRLGSKSLTPSVHGQQNCSCWRTRNGDLHENGNQSVIGQCHGRIR